MASSSSSAASIPCRHDTWTIPRTILEKDPVPNLGFLCLPAKETGRILQRYSPQQRIANRGQLSEDQKGTLAEIADKGYSAHHKDNIERALGKTVTREDILYHWLHIFDKIFFFKFLGGRVTIAKSSFDYPDQRGRIGLTHANLDNLTASIYVSPSLTASQMITTLLNEMVHAALLLGSCTTCCKDFDNCGKSGHGTAWLYTSRAIALHTQFDEYQNINADMELAIHFAEELAVMSQAGQPWPDINNALHFLKIRKQDMQKYVDQHLDMLKRGNPNIARNGGGSFSRSSSHSSSHGHGDEWHPKHGNSGHSHGHGHNRYHRDHSEERR